MSITIIEIGTITIYERPTDKLAGHPDLTAYEIFTSDDARGHVVYTADVRLAVLKALELQQEGTNSQFAMFAARMLQIDGEIWS